MQIHFLQSDTWKEFQLALGNTIISGKGDGWSYLAMIEKDRFGKFAYAPYGPCAENEATLKQAIADMKQQAKAQGAYVLIVEPYLPITKEIAARVLDHRVKQRQPAATQHIDLTQTEDEIIAGMNATRRKQHRNHHKKGLSFEKSTDLRDIDTFVELLEGSSHEKGFFIRDRKYFETMANTLVKNGDAAIYIGKFEDKPIIAALVYDDADMRYYAYMGRDYAYEHLQANGPLVSRMILDAKADGKKIFDLFGIALDDDPSNPWHGFTTFKKTLGGYPVELAGTWEVGVKKFPYLLHRLAQKVRH